MASRNRRSPGPVHVCVLIALSIGVGILAGCGGSGKPAYCSSVSDLKSSVKELPNTNVVQNGVSALEAAVTKVRTNATAAANDAKGDFPSETGAMKTSVNELSTTVKQVVSSPTPETLARVPGEVSAVVNSVNSFTSATSSKCS